MVRARQIVTLPTAKRTVERSAYECDVRLFIAISRRAIDSLVHLKYPERTFISVRRLPGRSA